MRREAEVLDLRAKEGARIKVCWFEFDFSVFRAALEVGGWGFRLWVLGVGVYG